MNLRTRKLMMMMLYKALLLTEVGCPRGVMVKTMDF